MLRSNIARTLEELGLAPQPVTDANAYEWNYASLRNPPPLHPDAARWFLPIHRGIVPAKLIAAHDFALNGAVVRDILLVDLTAF